MSTPKPSAQMSTELESNLRLLAEAVKHGVMSLPSALNMAYAQGLVDGLSAVTRKAGKQ